MSVAKADLEEILAGFVDPDGPGAVVGLVADGELRAWAARGLADVEHGIPITDTTVFHVASLSKQFVAYACRLLAARGAVDLDAPVGYSIDRFPFSEITARQLIHHVSGLRDQWDLLLLAGRQIEDMITTEEILQLVRRQRELNFAPGSALAYCNTGYTLLACLLERSTGTSLDEVARAEIFDPLAMSSTRFVTDHHAVVVDRADSYYVRADGELARLALSYSTAGATGLNTTAADIARWAAAALEEPALSLLTETIPGAAAAYASGVLIEAWQGRRLIEHSGGDAGFRAHIAFFPDDRVATFVLANLAGLRARDLALRAAERALSLTRSPERDLVGVSGVGGLYLDPATGETHEIDCHEGRIELDGAALETHQGLELQLGPELQLHRTAMSPQRLQRAVRWAPSDAELDALVGDYWSDEIGARWTIERVDRSLAVEQPRWPGLCLSPTVENAFTFTIPRAPERTRVDIRFDPATAELFATTRRVHRLRFRRLSRSRG